MNIEWIVEKRAGILQSPENPGNSKKTISNLADKGFDVIITIDDYDFSISWKAAPNTALRHYRCALGNYPKPSEWELQHLNEFLLYELHHGRKTVLWCESTKTYISVKNSIGHFFRYENTILSEFVKSRLNSQRERAQKIPQELTHCSGCVEKRCITDLLCHITSVSDAEMILKTGSILSACGARGKSGQELALEKRNAAGDPPDYFKYVMFTFGNCTAGDRLVMERSLRTFPSERDLTEEFKPGVRFFFRYRDLVVHPGFRSDGYHYCKIKDRLELEPYLVIAIAPESSRTRLMTVDYPISSECISFVDISDKDLWSWSHNAYETAKESEKQLNR